MMAYMTVVSVDSNVGKRKSLDLRRKAKENACGYSCDVYSALIPLIAVTELFIAYGSGAFWQKARARALSLSLTLTLSHERNANSVFTHCERPCLNNAALVNAFILNCSQTANIYVEVALRKVKPQAAFARALTLCNGQSHKYWKNTMKV